MILKRCHDVKGPDEELGKMRRANRIPITELNQHITCTLCKGYFIDATTIIECLHTFCRSCIVKYLETNKYCPVCDVQVHKSKPLVNIRPDKTLQDVVYKLVPRLFQNEMQRRRDFYMAHPEVKPSGLEQRGEASYQHLLTPEETICLSLNYHDSSGPPRYLRCPAAVSVAHLQKLIRAKYDLNDSHRIDILHNQDTLNAYLTLMDIAYIYFWRRKGPLELTYRIYENRTKRLKVDGEEESQTSDECKKEADENDKSEGGHSSENNSLNNNNNNNWKEVQLRISENGEISVTDIIQDNTEVKRTLGDGELTEINYVIPPVTETAVVTTKESDAVVTTVTDTLIDGKKESALKVNDVKAASDTSETITVDIKSTGSDGNKESDVSTTKIDILPVTTVSTIATTASPLITTSTALTTTCSVVSSISTQVTSKIEHEPPKSVPETVTSSSMKNVNKIEESLSPISTKGVKHKLDEKINVKSSDEPPIKQPKQTILNHTLGIHNLSNNHPLKKHSQMSTEVSVTKSTIVEANQPPTIINKTIANQQVNRSGAGTAPSSKWKSSTPGPPCYMPKTTYSPIINVPKLQASVSKVNDHKQSKPAESKMTPQVTQSNAINNKPIIKSKPSTPIGYKTLRDPPKTWNPQISRANLNRAVADAKCSDLKNIRPPKFFKLRNNMPRYLGNPASGVKPMYQVHLSPEKETKSDKSEIKKHSIVKIDPKTLKPISERAPETSNLSRTSESKFVDQDLKINTSSVPIFNPLKLQSSPKSDRKSPKSPHSPKTKSTSPPNRREKLNLSFTPPNPFIPNLTSPNMNPNQFLFSAGPPGFPSYDPRVMAAYHTFLYGQQRMAFNPSPIPGLNLDLNQRNNFDIVSPISPKLAQNKPSSTETGSNNSSCSSTSSGSNHRNNVKKSKEASKNEKSLQNAVEKLTQNKIKEVATKLGINEKEREAANVVVVLTDVNAGAAPKDDGENNKAGEKASKPVLDGGGRSKAALKEAKGDKSNENSDTNNIKEKAGDDTGEGERKDAANSNNNDNSNNNNNSRDVSSLSDEKVSKK